METLGHSQIGVIMDTCALVLPALQREDADGMHRALAGEVAVDEPTGRGVEEQSRR